MSRLQEAKLVQAQPEAPRELDDKGRCCGRKPLIYKRDKRWSRTRDFHYFCCRCAREFNADGKQRQSFSWKLLADGQFLNQPCWELKEMGLL